MHSRLLLIILASTVLLTGIAMDPTSAANQSADTSPEHELVNRYAPVIGLKDQQQACDEDGEAFYPVSVDVVIGNDQVLLKRRGTGPTSADAIVALGPTAADLYGRGDQYYLDFPGNPRHPGCSYEQWFDSSRDGHEPMTYAHIVSNGTNRLAIQYWFYYVFNWFNNTHESDWEMMQVVFDVGTVEQALQTEPVSVALAQHGGGETADWTDSKLQKEGERPVVYSAAGSHATQYGNAVYLGWGENGTGFGCDITTGPSTLVPLDVTLLPSTEPDPRSDLAWLNFTGRWGERQQGEFNGPTGPATKTQWRSPFLWQNGLRDSSIEVPGANTFGAAPTDVFCSVSAWGSRIFRQTGDSPVRLLSIAAVVLIAVGFALSYTWPTIHAAVRVYRSHLRTFIPIGLWLIPVGIFFNGFQFLVTHIPPGSTLIKLADSSSPAYLAAAVTTLVLQQLASLIIVGPMVIVTYDAFEKGRTISFGEAWHRVFNTIKILINTVGRVWLTILLLSITIIGIPIAIWLGVRWTFVTQAALMDDPSPRGAMEASSASVRDRWLRTALTTSMLGIFASAPGVIIGLLLMILGGVSVQATNSLSSLIYVATFPVSILGATLLYRNRTLTPPFFSHWRNRNRPKPSDAATSPDPVST